MDTKKLPKRHKHSRTVVRWPVSVFTSGNRFEAETESISPEGVLISCKESPPLEGSFGMLIKAPNRYPMKVTAKLVWTTLCDSEDGTPRLGADIQFLSISEKDRQFLQNLIATYYKRKLSQMVDNSDSAVKPGREVSKGPGCEAPQERTHCPANCDEVPVKIRARLHMTDIARALGTDYEVLKKLNPEFGGYYLPAGHYKLRVPSGLGFKVASVLTQLTRTASRRMEQNSNPYYIVQPGDSLKQIAMRTGVSQANLARLNGIHGSSLKVGQKLKLTSKLRRIIKRR